MNWKSIVEAGNGEQMSEGILDVIENQGDVDYLNEIQGIVEVNIYVDVPPQEPDDFVDDVIVASLVETGYDEFESFRCFDASDDNEPALWTKSASQWTFDPEDKAMQVAKQRGVVSQGRRVFGTVRCVVEAAVPVNWSDEEKKYTCLGKLVRDGPDRVLDVDWTEIRSPPTL